ncbi:MAG: FecR family protein [Pseudobdellovibrio sp.]
MFTRFFIALILVLTVPITSFAKDEGIGIIMIKEGSVKITDVAGEIEANVTVGLVIEEGDVIETGADSYAKIVMHDRNILNIPEKSRIIIRHYESQNPPQVDINLQEGQIRSEVMRKYDQQDSHFEISTPTAVAGVRGTDFLVEFNGAEEKSAVTTFRGTVAFAEKQAQNRGKPVLVNAGERVVHDRKHGFGAIRKVEAGELNKLRNKFKAKLSRDNAKNKLRVGVRKREKKRKKRRKDTNSEGN